LPFAGDLPVIYSTLWVDYSAYDRNRFYGVAVPWEWIKALGKAILGKDRWLPWTNGRPSNDRRKSSPQLRKKPDALKATFRVPWAKRP
jgi:hypothetical protein